MSLNFDELSNQFNEMAYEFLCKMRNTFPNEEKISSYISKFELLINNKILKNKPVLMFMDSMTPYGEQILRKDEIFFKKDEYVNKAEKISGRLGLIDHWDSMSNHVKDIIWEDITNLFLLGSLCIGKEEEIKILLNKIKS